MGGNQSKTKAVVFDLEGTLLPANYIEDTVYPWVMNFIRTEIPRGYAKSSELAKYVDHFPDEHKKSPADVVAHIEDLVAKKQQKVPYFLALQAYLLKIAFFKESYLKRPVYADVHDFISESKVPVCIFSQSPRSLQGLLLWEKDYEDEEGNKKIQFFREYIAEQHLFSTAQFGPKTNLDEYRKVQEALNLPPGSILYICDSSDELKAAEAAGWQTQAISRPGNPPLDSSFNPITTLEGYEIS